MKKYCLSIVLIGSFLLALMGAGNASFAETIQNNIEGKQVNNYAASFQRLPHTEFEIHHNQNPTANSGGYRFQHLSGSISFEEYSNKIRFNSHWQCENQESNFSFKDYLSHIYPSHNFW